MIIQRMGCGVNKAKGKCTLVWRSWLLLAAISGALCLSPVPATAAFIVSFDLNSAKLEYVEATHKLTITENLGSDLLVREEDGIDVLDSAKIVGGGDFNFTFTLDLLAGSGTDDWSASGTLKFTDTDQTSDAVSGDFTSSSVEIFPFAGGVLQIEGTLYDNTPSILQNRGNPWEFIGEETIPGEHTGDGTDGKAGQITINSPGAYDDGVVFILKFGVGTNSLDTLFGDDFTKTGGEVKGHISPEPATLGLLALGGMVLLSRRKRNR